MSPKPKKKAPPKKVVKKTVAKKAAPKKSVSKKPAAKQPKPKKVKGGPGRVLPREYDEHGYVVGSDSSKIAEVLLEGGESRTQMNDLALKAIGRKTTPDGNPINMSSLIASQLKQLQAKGYTVESSWVLKPPTAASKSAATRKANKASKSTPKKKAVKKVAKKHPARKAVK